MNYDALIWLFPLGIGTIADFQAWQMETFQKRWTGSLL